MMTEQAKGQAVTIIHSFSDGTEANDGSMPEAGLIQGSNGDFYGMTPLGGSAGKGAVYSMSPQGHVVILHSFGDGTVTNDGSNSFEGLVEGADGNFYGTTQTGGAASQGTVYKITPAGAVTILHSFQDGSVTNDGKDPAASLIQASDGNFYGTTYTGGTAGDGTIFKITPQGVETVLHSFEDGTVTNDGEGSVFNLVQATDGNFYGLTLYGGSAGTGSAFKMTPQGVVTIIHSFGDGSVLNDGLAPAVALVQASDGNFYGSTPLGGTANLGTAFKMTPQGAVTILHNFGDGSVPNDGNNPSSTFLIGLDGNFYGITNYGGAAKVGVVYEISPQGIVTILHSFEDGSVANDGNEGNSNNGLIQGSDGNFYGAARLGGTANQGAFFKIVPALPAILSSPTIGGTLSLPFSYQTKASNVTTSYSVANLPPGLSLDPTTGLITGTPTTAATTTATLTMTNAVGSNTVLLTFTIAPLPLPTVTSLLYAYGSVDTPFSYAIQANNNTTSYSSSSGLGGTGLMLNSSTGVISGSPTTAGTFAVSIMLTNATGTSPSVTLYIKITSAPPALSQEYIVLHRFSDGNTPNDGASPISIFQGLDGTFHGVTRFGGTGASGGNGTLFNMTGQGTVSTLTSFVSGYGVVFFPKGIVQASDGTFYVTGSSLQQGQQQYTIGKVTLQGSQYFLSALFGSAAGTSNNPPIQGADGNLYGVTQYGGSTLSGTNGGGTIYKITPQGVVTILHSFSDGSVTNDGVEPFGGLVQDSSGNFYGTTLQGGLTPGLAAGAGTIFKVTPQGQYTVLHRFYDGSLANDGIRPVAGLILGANGDLYGTTAQGGISINSGTVFQATTQGTVTILHNFGDGSVTNDGANPEAPLLQGYDGNFYGTTEAGGSASLGTAFEITPAGTVTIMHHFGDGTVANDGASPQANLIQGTDGNFYGVTYAGGVANGSYGTVFAIVARQTSTHAPVFIGATSASSTLNSPLTFTPKVEFGVSSTGTQTSGIVGEMLSLFPSLVHPAFSQSNWTLTGTLPNSLAFDSTSGTISGTPIQSGTFSVTLQPHNAIGDGVAQTITIYIDVPPTVNSATVAAGSQGSSFNYQITGTAMPSLFGATELPNWLSVNTTSGMLSGTPPGPGTYIFNPNASNYAGTGTQRVTLTVTNGSSSAPSITSATSITGSTGVPFTYQIAATHTPTSFSALVLPVGLLFNPGTGLISGTPTTAGVYSVPVTATNSSGTTATEVTITIGTSGAPHLPAELYVNAAPNVALSYQIPATGSVSLYNATGLPTTLTLDPATGIISGTPTSTGTLAIAVSATNSSGTANSTLNLIVETVTPTTYSQWAMQYPTLTGGMTGTPEEDGVPNLLKYIYDIDPTSSLSAADKAALPTLGMDSTTNPGTKYLTLTYQQYAALNDVSVHLQTSTDLVNWTTVTPDLTQQVGVNSTTGDPILEMGVITTGATKFIRLDVSSP